MMELQLVAEVVKPYGSDRPALVVFMAPSKTTDLSTAELMIVVQQLTSNLKKELAEVVPASMIPAGYISLETIPVTPTGKTDRRQLRQHGASLSLKQIGANDRTCDVVVDPTSPAERLLRDVWAKVLNIPPTTISIETPFTRLGGDSITAMQVMSRCRAHDMSVKMADILRLQTIRCIALQCQLGPMPKVVNVEGDQDKDVSWALSPIQKMFLDANPSEYNHCNQSFILKMRSPEPLDLIQKALFAVVRRHQMLRARFRRHIDGQWEQYVLPFDPTVVGFEQHVAHTKEEVELLAQRRQLSLDIQNGPVFAIDVFENYGEGQTLLLSAHHLVMDLFSWRVIWHDLQECLNGNDLPQSTTSFQKWCDVQQREGEHLVPEAVLPFKPHRSQFDYWGVAPDENLIGMSETLVDVLDSEATSLLLGKSNEVFSTETTDILVALLDQSFRQTFTDREAPAIFFEGHGREQIPCHELDVSETVGWFTTLHPRQMSLPPNSGVMDAVKAAKAVRQRVPGKGRPYFACQRYSPAGQAQLSHMGAIEVMLIYTGQFQQLEDSKSKLILPTKPMDLEQTSPAIRRFGLIEVTVDVKQGQMVVTFAINKQMRHRALLQRWAQAFTKDLNQLAYSLADLRRYG
ncbi:hypothetical protein K431DRAFT_250072 [Polychaeton citri CBS 116435]|uniref:Carrier domain-containing protein n=1 Tax=Polychaeton citri CBS 116435 TaxID=1314669 RepID=A0A9P4Q8J4_9PEZI|nr:hypothetical protein K431DRAFT_250072 [Polychaeton citri CBS 116435]